jgi:glycosyltransferase involved in cell wall biosynthesis
MKVALYSPLPPAPTGVADYSAALLPYLQALGEIAPEASGADVALYHIGNNGLHRRIYRGALDQPGVVVLHDAVLQHLLLGTLDADTYVEEFVHNYGEWSRDLGRELWRQRARSGADARYFQYPMLKRIASVSRAVIVHNPAAAAAVAAHAPEARVYEIPHLFVRPGLPDAVETLRFRRSLGLNPRTLLIGTFGHQRETKRLAPLLRAFHRALGRSIDARLLVSGGFVSRPFERAMLPLLRHPAILRTGYLSESAFWKYAAATDVCVNLRYPSAGETSGVAIRLMGIGKAVVFTAGAAVERFPEDACLRVDAGPAEEDILTDYIVWLARNHEAAAAIGRKAAACIAREHAPELAARKYWDVLTAAVHASPSRSAAMRSSASQSV